MSEYQDEVLAGFEASLELYQSVEDGSCLFQFPLNSRREPVDSRNFIDCIGSTSPDALTLMSGGFLEDYQFTITCRKSDLPRMPISGDLILRNNRVSRVLMPDTNDISPLVILHCGTPDK